VTISHEPLYYDKERDEIFWELNRHHDARRSVAAGGASPMAVAATADGQVMTWDQASRAWVAKAPAPTVSNAAKSFIKPTEAGPDTPNTGGANQLRPGDLQITAENLYKELKFWNGTAWVVALSEDKIRQWISAGSLFRGVIKEATLTQIPKASLANRGFYFSWTGAPGYVVQRSDPGIGDDLATEVLQVGDWIQSDGTKWVHVPGDLLSKQRWDSLGSFAPWSDTSWESGALVSYKGAFWRASSLIAPGDAPPEVAAGNKWLDITPRPSIKLADLADVDDVIASTGQDGLVVWDEANQSFGLSRGINVDGIAFTATGPVAVIEGLLQDDLLSNGNLDSQVPSVKTVADAIRQLRLEDLEDCRRLNTAIDGETLIWSDADSGWLPSPLVHRLADLADVTLTGAPKTGQLLRYNADHWENLDPDFYTKTETDAKLTALVSGLEHEESVLSIANAPPAAPDQYDLHIVGKAPTGAWAGHPDELAEWDGKAWKFAAARSHEAHLVEADGITWSWNGTAWVKVAAAAPPIALGLAAPSTPANGQAWLDQGGGGLKVYDGSRWAAASSSYWEASVTMGANAGTVGNQIILAKGIVPTNDGIYISVVDTQTGHSGGRSAYAIHVFSTDSVGNAKAAPIHVEPAGTRFSKLHWFWKDSSDGYVLAATISEACVGAIYRVGLLSPTARLDTIHGDGNTLVTDSTSGTTIDVSTSTGVSGMSNDAFDAAVKAAAARVFPSVATPFTQNTPGTPSSSFTWLRFQPGLVHRWIVDVDKSAKYIPVLYFEGNNNNNQTARHDGILFIGADQFELGRSDTRAGPTHAFPLGWGDSDNAANTGNICTIHLEFYAITARHYLVVKYRLQYRRKKDDKASICEALMYIGGQDTNPLAGRYCLNAFSDDTPYEIRQY
jgi:Protein of unknown function (DUF2793)